MLPTVLLVPPIRVDKPPARLGDTGAAFSMLADSGGWQRWALVAVAAGACAALVLWLRREPSTPMRWGYALLLGGAVSNGVERAVRGYVKPFANWLWAGSLLMALGGGLSLSDRRYRVAAGARKAPVAGVPAE